jgi:hypothetical protein
MPVVRGTGAGTGTRGAGGFGGEGNARQEEWSAMAFWNEPNAPLNLSMAAWTVVSAFTWSRSPCSAPQSDTMDSLSGSAMLAFRVFVRLPLVFENAMFYHYQNGRYHL